VSQLTLSFWFDLKEHLMSPEGEAKKQAYLPARVSPTSTTTTNETSTNATTNGHTKITANPTNLTLQRHFASCCGY